MHRRNGRQQLEAAAERYRQAVEDMNAAPEGSEHWTARRRLARAQEMLYSAALAIGPARRGHTQ